jgi:hypothetical protein
MMKNPCAFLILMIAQSFVTPSSQAQDNDLCQGHYYTEAQGADKLAALAGRLRDKKNWDERADSIRARLRSGMELDEFPRRTALNPRHRNKKVLDGYTVESVVFESLPGFFVTGNLYRPTGKLKKGSHPVILSPHGHFPDTADYGRFRKDMQIRCASLARMGAVVFAYDMVGWGESLQLSHKHPKVLLFQTWNSIRVIDFMLTLPEADRKNIAVTGASGGGTQTFMVAAIDDRVKVSVPVVMVSSHFFGGCSCESGMPVHKNGPEVYTNAEIACVVAPKAMLWISDGSDWTKNTATVEFPFARKVYQLYDRPSMVEHVHLADEGHDYGKNKRLPMYRFLALHLGLKIENISDGHGKVSENFVSVLDQKSLTYFTEDELTALIKNDDVYKVFLQSKNGK